MAPAIPDRWLNYTPIGKRIEGTRFIAFKVPLREFVVESVDYKMRLDMPGLLRKVPNLGMIIDLTNTNRYYDPEYFRKEGVEHKKLMIPGHHTPPDDLVDKFKLYVMGFLNHNKDNDKLIGVHCTHGVNRTGYLICNFMISEMSIEPKDAIKKFDAARGHKIERKNYLEALDDSLKSDDIKPDENHETRVRSHRDSDKGFAHVYRNNKTDRDFTHYRGREERQQHTNNYHPYRRSTNNNTTSTSASYRDRSRHYRFSPPREDRDRNRNNDFDRRRKPYDFNEGRDRFNWRSSGRDRDRTSSYQRPLRDGGGERSKRNY